MWILLDKLDRRQLRNALDENYAKYVLEWDGDSDGAPDTDSKIEIVERDADGKRLQLERRPRTGKLRIEHNTYSIRKQRDAVKSLMFNPRTEHFALLKLFHDRGSVDLGTDWGTPDVDEWFVLRERAGSDNQKEFVETALATPDFAFLEGPPGSGKTATLCELVHQLTRRGKRVLFCASTHIAVDNLLEKITDKYTKKPTDSNIIPLRIGKSKKISPLIDGYLYDNVTKTIRKKILNHLRNVPKPNEQQKMLHEHLKSDDTVGRIARDCANLVCGTAIGVLQHPDIKNGGAAAMFDVMIMDEASKTTFQEFLVPALHARRWIIAGDTRQLAPHTSQEEIKPHVDRCIDRRAAQACCDAFLAHRNKTGAIAATDGEGAKNRYNLQCAKLGIPFQDADAKRPKTVRGGIVAGTAESLAALDKGFLEGAARGRVAVRGIDAVIEKLTESKNTDKAKLHLWKTLRIGGRGYDGDHEWGAQVAWRIMSEPANGGAGGEREKIEDDIEKLMPADEGERRNVDEKLDDVKRIALPSILQLLQQ